MTVSVALLRRVTTALFDHLERSGQNEIIMDKDFYWNIPDGSLYDPYQEPTKLTLGQLSDDLREIERLDAGESAPISYALVWVAALLRYVGSRVVS